MAEVRMGVTKSRPKKGANKIKRIGSRKSQIARYYVTAYPRNKLRRILDCNGSSAAQSWAAKHGCAGVLNEILDRRAK